MSNLIEIRDLSVAFSGQTVVRNLCLDIRPGECLALVGESGSGKSVTAHSILQLLPECGTETTGSIRYRGQELVGADARKLRELRGNRIAMIFQEPMTSLNPLHSIEKQIGETLLVHKGLAGKAAQVRILELLHLVGIQKPAGAAQGLSPSAVRRPAPAGDDRHGPGLRAGIVDRR